MTEATSPPLFFSWRKIAMAARRNAPMSCATADIDSSRLLEHIDQVRSPAHTSDLEGANR